MTIVCIKAPKFLGSFLKLFTKKEIKIEKEPPKEFIELLNHLGGSIDNINSK